jgi:cytochrome c oxidase subunit 4
MAKRNDGELDLEQLEESRIHSVSLGRYFATWAALTLLTFATFGLSRLQLGPYSVVIALVIAVIKSALVVLYFMHLSHERGSIPFAIATGVTLLIVLVGLAVADLANRFPLSVPGSSASASVLLRGPRGRPEQKPWVRR